MNNPGVHAVFALIAFLFANFIPIAISTILPKPLNILSILTGVVGLFFLFVHLLSDMNLLSLYGLIGHGGSERMIVYPALLWLVAFGGYLMASSPEKITESAS